jgi:CTP synthase (UTP-ammonia lyase)
LISTNAKATPNAIVGKYFSLHDSYLSVHEALKCGGIAHRNKVKILWVASCEIAPANVAEKLTISLTRARLAIADVVE